MTNPFSESIHSCSYYCERPECIKRQRDEMRDAQDAKPVAFRWVMTYETGEWRECVSSDGQHNPWGIPGVDFNKSYPVTCEPLYAAPQPQAAPQEPVAYITEDTLANLLDETWKAQRNLPAHAWTTNNPPSRAIVPLYASPAVAAPQEPTDARAMAGLLEEAREKLRLLWIRSGMEDSDHEWLMATDDTLAAWKDKP